MADLITHCDYYEPKVIKYDVNYDTNKVINSINNLIKKKYVPYETFDFIALHPKTINHFQDLIFKVNEKLNGDKMIINGIINNPSYVVYLINDYEYVLYLDRECYPEQIVIIQKREAGKEHKW
jgi:hypothetical protein